MLNDISINSTARFREIRSFLTMLRNISPTTPTSPPEIAVSKGLFFVNLYGAFEYTVTSSVQKTLSIIDSKQIPVTKFKPTMLSLVLDSQCRSISAVGSAKLWEKRWELFNQLSSSNVVSINNTVMPTDGSNIKYGQLSSIWTTLCIKEPVVPTMIYRGRLEEMAENRNAIAHGRESAATIGRRYSINDLEQRFNDINTLCIYIIQCLENYLTNDDFLL